MKKAICALILIAASVLSASAQCDVTVTTANFASVFSSTQSGTICLATGNYGNFSGGAKSSMVTIQPAAGATVAFGNGNFGSSVRNITMKGPMKMGPTEVSPPTVKMNLIFDGVDWGSSGHQAHEGRLSIIGGGSNAIGSNGVIVKNSKFGPGGCADGIQDSSKGTEIGPNNEFFGIVQGGCSEHSDAIQPYASNYIWIHGNYLHDNEQGIMSPDGVSTGYLIENNVIHTTTGYPCMHMGDTRSGTISRNVCRNGGIRIYGGNQNVPSQNMTIQNNVAGVDNSGCTGCTITGNVSPSSVTFVGGAGRCAYKTTSGTAGLNDCGVVPPPPPPPPPPTPTNCTVSTTSFQNTPFTLQNGTFAVEYDATPSNATMDAVFGLSNGPSTSYNSNAIATRFESSTIQARSGNDYVPIPNAGFVAGTTYHFRLVVRIPTHTYDVFVNAVGSTVVNSLVGLAFRFEQSNVAQLNNWSTISITGTQQVCNFTLGTTPPPNPTLTLTCAVLACQFTQTSLAPGSTITVVGTGPSNITATSVARVP